MTDVARFVFLAFFFVVAIAALVLAAREAERQEKARARRAWLETTARMHGLEPDASWTEWEIAVRVYDRSMLRGRGLGALIGGPHVR